MANLTNSWKNRLLSLNLMVLGILSVTAEAQVYSEGRPILEISTGRLQGVNLDGLVWFKNIPYAAPPVGELRWRPPQPAANWEGVRDASQFGQACPQTLVQGLNSELAPGNEDCLKLNVYAPVGAKDLPVMVWFHGGGLAEGSATEPYYQPFGLAKEGAVVVTVDYRLGKLGFFAPEELVQEAKKNGEPFGNYGTMDQIASLKWVQDNIARFGGNPDNVTIFGQSAGGRSVTWLMVSPAAKGLFHKAIAQSPQQLPLRELTTEKFGMISQQNLDSKYMQTLGVDRLAALRALPTEKLVVTSKEFQLGEFGGAFIDGQIVVGDPLPLFAMGKQHKVPLIIGTNSWDASFFALGQPPVNDYLEKMGQDPERIKGLYASYSETCALSSQIMADGWYTGAVKQLADSANRYAPAYAYYYAYVTPHIRDNLIGAAHTFELPYVFGSLELVLRAPVEPEPKANKCAKIEQAIKDMHEKAVWSSYWFPTAAPANELDQSISQQLMKSWVEFARTGNPNPNGGSFWPRYELEADVMREFSESEPTLVNKLFKDRVDYQLQSIRRIYRMN